MARFARSPDFSDLSLLVVTERLKPVTSTLVHVWLASDTDDDETASGKQHLIILWKLFCINSSEYLVSRSLVLGYTGVQEFYKSGLYLEGSCYYCFSIQ